MLALLKILPIKHLWNRIANNSPHFLPTQEYDYQKYLFWSFYSHPRRMLRSPIKYIHISEGNDECIFPMVVNKTSKQLFGLSHFGRLDYDDIIATTDDPALLIKMLQKGLLDYHDYHVFIPNINENSLLYSVFRKRLKPSDNCVKISLPSSHNSYIHSLTKHQQQNIRTSYNKMARNGISYHLEEYDVQNKIPHKMWKHLCLLHHKRHKEHVTLFNLFRNPYYHILKKAPNHHIFVLFDNNVPMAYMAGLFSTKRNTYYIPRLCINEEYATYSPGIVLLCETIKQLIINGISCIDLMIGDEPYKLAMGGTIHKNYYLDCNVNDLLS